MVYGIVNGDANGTQRNNRGMWKEEKKTKKEEEKESSWERGICAIHGTVRHRDTEICDLSVFQLMDEAPGVPCYMATMHAFIEILWRHKPSIKTIVWSMVGILRTHQLGYWVWLEELNEWTWSEWENMPFGCKNCIECVNLTYGTTPWCGQKKGLQYRH